MDMKVDSKTIRIAAHADLQLQSYVGLQSISWPMQ